MPVITTPKILLPNSSVDMNKWASVACDQFCAEPKYWEELEALVGDAPSTLKLTLPEIYLKGDLNSMVSAINSNMHAYINSGILEEVNNYILVERSVGKEKRIGVMVALDLDSYDWNRVRVPVRATEATIMERLPVRIDIRSKAPIELPHAMILIDDKEHTVIEPMYAEKDSFEKVYDFDLNMGGGHITGYKVPENSGLEERLNALLEPSLQVAKYGNDAGILMAVGDGNHSIATAKVMWEKVAPTLTEEEKATHPARYALVEVVNIYGGGMVFEPIHRIIFNADNLFVEKMKRVLEGSGRTTLITAEGDREIATPATSSLAINAIQEFIEREASLNPKLEIEYVHNTDRLRAIVAEEGGVGIIMPTFATEELFPYVVNVGNLPKKSFSIGEPEEKRYYLEAKKI
ncbi:MAG: DUF1015 domain-containing protein [Bacillota bacterium]